MQVERTWEFSSIFTLFFRQNDMTCAVFFYLSALSTVQITLPIVLPPGWLDLGHPSSELKFKPPLVSFLKLGFGRSRPSFHSSSLPLSITRRRFRQRSQRLTHAPNASHRRATDRPRPQRCTATNLADDKPRLLHRPRCLLRCGLLWA